MTLNALGRNVDFFFLYLKLDEYSYAGCYRLKKAALKFDLQNFIPLFQFSLQS